MTLRIREEKNNGTSSFFIEVFSKYKESGFWQITEREEWVLLWEYCGDKYKYEGFETKNAWKPVVFESLNEAEIFVRENYTPEESKTIIHEVKI